MKITGATTAPWTHRPHRFGRLVRHRLRWKEHDGEHTAILAVHHYPAAGSPERQRPAGEHRPDPPRLLMVHGFRGDHHGMQLLVDCLPDYEIWVPDLPGFGQSPLVRRVGSDLPVTHDLSTYAAAVAALAEDLAARPDVLIGHSFGSVVAAAAAARAAAGPTPPSQPAPWAGLGLIAPLTDPLFTSRMLPSAAGVELYYRLAGALPRRAGDALLGSAAGLAVTNLTMITAADPRIRSYVRRQHRLHFSDYADRRALLEAYRASSRHTVLDFADQVPHPVLLLCGARDGMSTGSGRRRLRRSLPDARLEVLSDVGHLIHYEKPAAAARALRRFIRQL